MVGPVAPSNPYHLPTLGPAARGALQLRLRDMFGKLVTQGDLEGCAGLLGRKAEVWSLRNGETCLTAASANGVSRWRDGK